MPRGDQTGPYGLGPMTGRGMGYCAGFPVPGCQRPVGWGFGRGGGWRRARGFKRSHWYPPVPFHPAYAQPYAPAPPSDEARLEFLKSEAERLETALAELNARIEELSSQEETE
jgi:hypothetical protein